MGNATVGPGGGGGGASVPSGHARPRRIIIERQDGWQHGNVVNHNGQVYFSVTIEGSGMTAINLSHGEMLAQIKAWA